jgi:HD-GYP domain-containing protein (c-di-GMP phosphodiesterase class II)
MRFVRRWAGIVAMLGVPVALLVVLRSSPSLDVSFGTPDAHLVVVGGIAGCALAVACLSVVAALRSEQPGPVLLGVGCASLGTLMLGHGLTTPTVLGTPFNQWVGRLPYLALVLFTVCLALAARPAPGRAHRWITRHPLWATAVPTAAVALLVAALVSDPTSLHGAAPLAHEDRLRAIAAAAAALTGVRAASVHWRRWLLGNDAVQLSLAFAASMAVAAATALELGTYSRVSWWDYHGYLLAGFGAAVWAVVGRYRDTAAATSTLDAAFVDDPFDHIVRGHPAALRTLVGAVERKDAYTHGHSERTALLATQLGLRMGLPSDVLRAVARGAFLHDVGKIAIPDAILNKPGALTPEERRIIETHPEVGHEMASGAPQLAEALPVILHHHERFDGTGYPHGLVGEAIPLVARVVAVADVWDALTTDRAYRPGWSPARALDHIEAGRGTHFDPAAVDALVAVAAGWGIDRAGGAGDAAEAWQAVQDCHHIDASRQLVSR